MVMMEIAECLRAKSKDDKNFLLRDHLKETVKCAISLKEFVEKNRGAIDYEKFDQKFFENLIIASFLHDLGKIDWKFQLKLFDKNEKEYDLKNRRYKSEELNTIAEFFTSRDIEIKDHEVISVLYSLLFLGNDDDAIKIRTAILLHHYNDFYVNKEINMLDILTEYPDLIKYIEFLVEKKEKVKDVLQKILDSIAGDFEDSNLNQIFDKLRNNIKIERIQELKNSIDAGYGISTKLKMFNIPDKENENFYDFFVFLGCLRRCDYSASGNVEIESAKKLAEEVYNDLNKRIKEKIQTTKELWQEKILTEKDAKNLVLIAPTGSGKTEFALLWAKNRGKKLVYTIPLRAALNDLYERFGGKDSQNEGYFYSANNNILRILHSTAFLEYLKEEKDGKQLDIEEKQTTAQLFSSAITLTTPDQVFLSSLKYYGFDKLLSVFPLSSIVIDEIQAYNPEMAAVIIKTMEIIQKLGGNTLVITATFPPYFEEFINEKKDFKIVDLKDYPNNSDVKNYKLMRHRIEVIEQKLFEVPEKNKKNLEENEESAEDIHEKEKGDAIYHVTDTKEVIRLINENQNKNILIIVNNVGKAIQLFKLLENNNEIKERVKIKDGNEEVHLLLHSRLIEKEKARRIEAVKKELNNKKNGMILVSTQIVEASVDIDFDMLITEISPVDSQIQRWGRIYRNRKDDYNEEKPNIYIFAGIDKGTTAIYESRVIEKTVEKLKNKKNSVLNYENERELIECVFKEKINGKTLKEEYIEEINKNLEWLKYYSTEKRGEAQRVFRGIAGVQVVLPALMKASNDPVEKKLGQILDERGMSPNLSWKIICENINQNLKPNTPVDFWHILKIIYEYSCSVPFYYFEKRKLYGGTSFKGFFIMSLKDDEIEDVKKYGNIKLKELEQLQIEESILS
jgi:CRISPR-associated endonuclease/helicase Cas3